MVHRLLARPVICSICASDEACGAHPLGRIMGILSDSTTSQDHDMIRLRPRLFGGAVGVAVASSAAMAGAQVQAPGGQPAPAVGTSIAERTRGMDRKDGFIPLHLDTRQGKLLLELPRDSMRALYYIAQATGLGSNPVGI